MTYSVYALYSANLNQIYIGQTNDLKRRISEHKKGYSKYTSRENDWELFYFEEVESRSQAKKREKQLKSAGGRVFLRSKINK